MASFWLLVFHRFLEKIELVVGVRPGFELALKIFTLTLYLHPIFIILNVGIVLHNGPEVCFQHGSTQISCQIA